MGSGKMKLIIIVSVLVLGASGIAVAATGNAPLTGTGQDESSATSGTSGTVTDPVINSANGVTTADDSLLNGGAGASQYGEDDPSADGESLDDESVDDVSATEDSPDDESIEEQAPSPSEGSSAGGNIGGSDTTTGSSSPDSYSNNVQAGAGPDSGSGDSGS